MPDPIPARATSRLAQEARLWRSQTDPGRGSGPGSTDSLVAAATDCLVAGVDSPALRELAGVSPDESRYVVGPLLDKVLQELGIQDAAPAAGADIDLERLRGLVAVVLRDVGDLGPDLQIEVVPGSAMGADPGTVYLRIQDGLTMLYPGPEGSRPAEELARLADQLHEWIVEELPSHHRPTNWPPCPVHPDTHPLEVRLDQDDVVWACPRAGTTHARVGELAQRDPSSGP